MRRQYPAATFVTISSVVLAGCGTTVRNPPKAPTASAAEVQPATVAAPTPPTLPFRLPCGENDLEGCTKGCDEHVTEDCTTLAVIYYEGKGIEPNPVRGIELFRGACLNDSARACIKLADLYHSAVLNDDPAAEAVLYTRACDAGANRGCLGAGRAYIEGRGVDRSPALAAKHFSRVCDLGNAEACLELAKLYDRGDGVKKDTSLAMRLYTKACQLGLGEACVTADPKGEVDAAPPRE
jgi:uncharacterized protein